MGAAPAGGFATKGGYREVGLRTHHATTKRRPRALGATGLCLSILLVTAANAQAPPGAAARPPASPPVPSEPGVPVTLGGEVLFYVHNFLGRLIPGERARAARRRLIRIADDPFCSEDLFSLQKSDRAVAQLGPRRERVRLSATLDSETVPAFGAIRYSLLHPISVGNETHRDTKCASLAAVIHTG
jgi:hypothetical protein